MTIHRSFYTVHRVEVLLGATYRLSLSVDFKRRDASMSASCDARLFELSAEAQPRYADVWDPESADLWISEVDLGAIAQAHFLRVVVNGVGA